MRKKRAKTYLEKRLQDKKFREGFISEYQQALLSEKLAKMRHEAHLTQADLAKKLHTTKSVISRYESGRYSGYSVITLLKIAHACGRDINIEFPPIKKKKKLRAAKGIPVSRVFTAIRAKRKKLSML
ncbi:helix-turn-helix transcriptional regulator [Candidatus Omnitrophota bacterium]